MEGEHRRGGEGRKGEEEDEEGEGRRRTFTKK